MDAASITDKDILFVFENKYCDKPSLSNYFKKASKITQSKLP
jgi:hypothetical protein